MRRSSRIVYFLGLSLLLVSGAEAGGIGIARGLSPIHPLVGASRGLPPVPSASSPHQAHGNDRPWRRGVSSGYGLSGYGIGEGGFAGIVPETGALDQGGSYPDRGPDLVIPAPPRPCVSPQIIRIGKAAQTDRLERSSRVRVIYGVPGCGRS